MSVECTKCMVGARSDSTIVLRGIPHPMGNT